jgi:hypothetical protein
MIERKCSPGKSRPGAGQELLYWAQHRVAEHSVPRQSSGPFTSALIFLGGGCSKRHLGHAESSTFDGFIEGAQGPGLACGAEP